MAVTSNILLTSASFNSQSNPRAGAPFCSKSQRRVNKRENILVRPAAMHQQQLQPPSLSLSYMHAVFCTLSLSLLSLQHARTARPPAAPRSVRCARAPPRAAAAAPTHSLAPHSALLVSLLSSLLSLAPRTGSRLVVAR